MPGIPCLMKDNLMLISHVQTECFPMIKKSHWKLNCTYEMCEICSLLLNKSFKIRTYIFARVFPTNIYHPKPYLETLTNLLGNFSFFSNLRKCCKAINLSFNIFFCQKWAMTKFELPSLLIMGRYLFRNRHMPVAQALNHPLLLWLIEVRWYSISFLKDHFHSFIDLVKVTSLLYPNTQLVSWCL